MFSKKDAEIMAHLRKNARKKITTIAAQINIPVTTIYDKVRVHNKRYVKKHVALLDFQKLGLFTNAHLAIKVDKNSREGLKKHLQEHVHVNSLYRTNTGYDFLVEAVFKDPGQLQGFIDNIESAYKIDDIKVFSIVEELKKEEFLTEPEHISVLE